MNIISLIVLCFFYAVLNVGGATIIKRELATHALESIQDYITLLFNYKVILAFGTILLSALVLFKALSTAKFSIVLPIANGINFGLTVGVGVILFHDKITIYHILGLFLILSGIIVIAVVEKAS